MAGSAARWGTTVAQPRGLDRGGAAAGSAARLDSQPLRRRSVSWHRWFFSGGLSHSDLLPRHLAVMDRVAGRIWQEVSLTCRLGRRLVAAGAASLFSQPLWLLMPAWVNGPREHWRCGYRRVMPAESICPGPAITSRGTGAPGPWSCSTDEDAGSRCRNGRAMLAQLAGAWVFLMSSSMTIRYSVRSPGCSRWRRPRPQ